MAAVRSLTDEQVNQLFVFCRKHYVHHYDVQVELVDHLAKSNHDNLFVRGSTSF